MYYIIFSYYLPTFNGLTNCDNAISKKNILKKNLN